jgi:hypothetical protein
VQNFELCTTAKGGFGWQAAIRSGSLNDASAPEAGVQNRNASLRSRSKGFIN